MSKLGILGATALSLTLAIAAPAYAAGRGGGAHFGGGGAHAGGGGIHMGGGAMHMGGGGMHMGGGAMGAAAPHMGGNVAAFRGAQASMGPARTAPVSGGNFAGRAQFAQGGYRNHGYGHRGFGAGAGFVAGLAAGSVLGYGNGYDPSYYGPDYAYDDGYYDGAYPVDPGYVASPGYVVSSNDSVAYCEQRYKSYDPASGTYLGYDGLRHPCPQ